MGDRKLGSVHVQLLKKYEKPKQVKRVTSVLEGDTELNDIVTRYSEAKVETQQLQPDQEDQLQRLLQKHKTVLTKEPELTREMTFGIDTGDAQPIFQHAYNTPASLKQSVDVEIDWLLSQGYIRLPPARGHPQWLR